MMGYFAGFSCAAAVVQARFIVALSLVAREKSLLDTVTTLLV